MWGTGAALATVGAAGCSSPVAPTTPAPSGAFPVSVPGKEGTATIPAEPNRLFAAGLQRDADIAIALGVTPVAMAKAASFTSGIAPWVETRLGQSKPELVDMSGAQPPLEQIAALEPDLISAVDDYALANHYAQFSRIAPTLSYVEAQNIDTWQQSTTRIAQALGRETQAPGVIAATEGAIAQAAGDNPGLRGKTFSFSVVYSGVIYTVLPGDAAAVVLTQLGLQLAPSIAGLPESATKGRAQVSAEQLSVLDADVTIVSYPTPAERAAIERNPLFPSLDAVKRGAYFELEFSLGVALAFPSPLATPYAVNGLVPALNRALSL
ncbi:MAG: hypothetical protein ABS81_14990 [Pseudonocardia sp. SCN 72-86]|nr:MAG: hypothetical protein ABS81_14990 [Pseudonocardia sp. SCN 72-86]